MDFRDSEIPQQTVWSSCAYYFPKWRDGAINEVLN